jgi:hypothetical protein
MGTNAPIPDTFTNLVPTNLVQSYPETATLYLNFAGEPAQETVIYNGQAAGTNSPPAFVLTGSGGPKGKYRVQVRATFGGGSLTLNGPSNFAQTFAQNETVDMPLAAGTYSWSWTGSPTGCNLKIGAI